MKRAIFNADDFGMDSSINEAVEKAHKNGLLTSASLAANGGSFEEAVDIAKRNKGLGVGIHLVLNGEKPVSPPEEIPSIVDGKGRLIEDHGMLCLGIIKGNISLAHIARECEAQITKFLDSGLVPTHADSHRHLHLFTPIFNVLDSLLKKYGISKIRSLKIPGFEFGRAGLMKAGFLFFAGLSNPAAKGYKSPDRFLGYFNSGGLNLAYLTDILPRLGSGVSEINFHPGMDNAKLLDRYGIWKERYSWKCDWAGEYALLINPEVREIVSANGISLTNYSEL